MDTLIYEKRREEADDRDKGNSIAYEIVKFIEDHEPPVAGGTIERELSYLTKHKAGIIGRELRRMSEYSKETVDLVTPILLKDKQGLKNSVRYWINPLHPSQRKVTKQLFSTKVYDR